MIPDAECVVEILTKLELGDFTIKVYISKANFLIHNNYTHHCQLPLVIDNTLHAAFYNHTLSRLMLQINSCIIIIK